MELYCLGERHIHFWFSHHTPSGQHYPILFQENVGRLRIISRLSHEIDFLWFRLQAHIKKSSFFAIRHFIDMILYALRSRRIYASYLRVQKQPVHLTLCFNISRLNQTFLRDFSCNILGCRTL